MQADRFIPSSRAISFDLQLLVAGALAKALCRTHEASTDRERRRRPIDGLPRFGILAGGELDEEVADERGGV